MPFHNGKTNITLHADQISLSLYACLGRCSSNPLYGTQETEIYANNATLVNVNIYILMVWFMIVLYLMALHMIYMRCDPVF